MTFTLPNASPQVNDPNTLRIMSQAIRQLSKGDIIFQGALHFIVANVVANSTLGNECVVSCDTTSGNIILTLPSALVFSGFLYFIKKADNSGNTVTIQGNENIDGSSSKVLNTSWESTIIYSNGTQWLTL